MKKAVPDPRTVPCRARCPNCPNRPNCPKSSRFSRRLSLLRRSSFGGWNRRRERAWGYAPHTRSRGDSPAPRGNCLSAISRMLWDHRSPGGTVRKAVPDPRTVPWFARCPNCPNCPKSSREMLWDPLCHCALTSSPFLPVLLSPLKQKQDCRNFASAKTCNPSRSF